MMLFIRRYLEHRESIRAAKAVEERRAKAIARLERDRAIRRALVGEPYEKRREAALRGMGR